MSSLGVLGDARHALLRRRVRGHRDAARPVHAPPPPAGAPPRLTSARVEHPLVEWVRARRGAQGAADDEALDLAGALEDRVELGVPVPLLHGEVLDVAPPAERLDRLLARAHADLRGLELGHRALGVLEGLSLRRHPGGAPRQQPGAVDVRGQVGERERDALVLDDRLAEGLARHRVVACELQRGTSDPDGLRGHHRARALEGSQRGRAAALHRGGRAALLGGARRRRLRALGLTALGDPLLEPLLAAHQLVGRHAAVLEDDLAGVRRAAAQLVELAQQRQARRALRHHEDALPAVPGVGIDSRDDDVDVGDAAVADEDLLAVDDPVAAVLAGARLDRAHVAAAARLGHRQRRELDVAGRAEALRRPAGELLVGRRLADRGQRERRQHDRQPDPGAAPEQLLHHDRQRQPGRIGRQLRVELPVIEALAGGFLEYGPRQLLLAVVLGGDRPDDLAGEPVTLVAQLPLIVGELEVEGHAAERYTRRVRGSSPMSPTSVRLLLVPGSLRAGSTNVAVLRTAEILAPDGVEAGLYAGMAELPHFNPDDDREGHAVHPAVAAMRAAVARADALLVCTPEYAGALPGALKNLLEWTVGDAGTYDKPVGWINAAGPAAPTGAADAHESLRKVLGYVGADLVDAACRRIPITRRDVGSDGLIVDPKAREAIRTTVTVLVEHVRHRRGRDDA